MPRMGLRTPRAASMCAPSCGSIKQLAPVKAAVLLPLSRDYADLLSPKARDLAATFAQALEYRLRRRASHRVGATGARVRSAPFTASPSTSDTSREDHVCVTTASRHHGAGACGNLCDQVEAYLGARPSAADGHDDDLQQARVCAHRVAGDRGRRPRACRSRWQPTPSTQPSN